MAGQSGASLSQSVASEGTPGIIMGKPEQMQPAKDAIERTRGKAP